jgi:hypothetical protein
MIYLRSLLVGILALFVSLYGLFLVFGLWMRLFLKSNTYYVVFHLRSPFVWVFCLAIFGAPSLFELHRGLAKAKS